MQTFDVRGTFADALSNIKQMKVVWALERQEGKQWQKQNSLIACEDLDAARRRENSENNEGFIHRQAISGPNLYLWKMLNVKSIKAV